MWSRTVGISPRDSASSDLKAATYDLHYVWDISYGDFSEANNINLLFCVFSALKKFSLIEQIIKFPAVNFVETYHQS